MKKKYSFPTLFSILLFLLVSVKSYSQFYLSVLPFPDNDSASSKKIIQSLSYTKTFADSLSRKKEIASVMNKLFEWGYLAASVDSVAKDSSKQINFIAAGEVYKWAKLTSENVDEGVLSESGFSEKNFSGKSFSPKQLSNLQKKILDWCENNGYPFATFKLDNVSVIENSIAAKLNLQKGSLIKIDSIVIKGNAKLKSIYLFNYLAINPGDVYNESLIKKISTRLKELPMVNELKPFVVEFYQSKARIVLYFEDKKASQLDGILGILPDASKAGKVTLTGEARLRLQSSFGRGELIDLNWKQPAPKTQDLKIKFNYPFLFSSPFGIDLGLSIYKKDTTYVDVTQELGLQYMLTGGNYFKVFVSDKNSSLLSTQTLQYASVLPEYADVSTITYGAGFKSEKLDYRLNPRRGYAFEITGGAGTKKISQNPKLKSELYNNIKLKSNQYNAQYTVDFYFPVSTRTVLNAGSKGAYFSAPEIFTNELYRFGGLKTLRGFDEESIYASEYYIGKLEYRYILEQNSYLFTFFNAAYYANRSRMQNVYDKPFGFGAGITFETKLGIFSLNYALGKQFSNPILFRSAKVHFGIVNYF